METFNFLVFQQIDLDLKLLVFNLIF